MKSLESLQHKKMQAEGYEEDTSAGSRPHLRPWEFLVQIVCEWSDIFMEKFATELTQDVHNGAFLFSAWNVWNYALHKNILPREDLPEITQNYLCTIAALLDSNHPIMDRFIELYKNRSNIFNYDIRGMMSTTSTHLPICSYLAFYVDQYGNLNPLVVEPEVRTNTEVLDKVCDFMPKFIMYRNEMLDALDEIFDIQTK